jgi:glutamyl-tRNA synthetase
LFNFILTWLTVKLNNGILLLRIDDLDQARIQAQYVEHIFRTLDWLGLSYDEGPGSPDELTLRWSQQHRLEDYFSTIHQLNQKLLLKACSCSRSDIQMLPIKMACPCMDKKSDAEEEPISLRIHIKDEPNRIISDVDGAVHPIHLLEDYGSTVMQKKDGMPSYQIASLTDDELMNVNFIVRGKDLLSSTAMQHYIAEKLNMSSFGQAKTYHHTLITDIEGAKLSKSAGSASIMKLDMTHQTRKNIFTQFSQWLNIPPSNSGITYPTELLDYVKEKNALPYLQLTESN